MFYEPKTEIGKSVVLIELLSLLLAAGSLIMAGYLLVL